jgi:hypothetical protein
VNAIKNFKDIIRIEKAFVKERVKNFCLDRVEGRWEIIPKEVKSHELRVKNPKPETIARLKEIGNNTRI